MSSRSEVLSTADHLISKDRADVYGPPRQSFGRIGALWGAMLDTDPIPPETVALMLVQLKVSRIVSSPTHEDSWVDLAGYAALGGELATEQTPKRLQLFASELTSEHFGFDIEFLDRSGVPKNGTLIAPLAQHGNTTEIRLEQTPQTTTYVDGTTLVLFTGGTP